MTRTAVHLRHHPEKSLVPTPEFLENLGFFDERPRRLMKTDIHPEYTEIKVTCSCGNNFTTRSTMGKPLQIEVCSSCHPFFTGKQKIVDTAGRVERFRQRYGSKTQ